MGKLSIDGTVSVDFDDRLLAHLQLVIGAKLRRGESFHLTWRDEPEIGEGRTIVWIHPATPIQYRFDLAEKPQLNRAWLEALTLSAASASGLELVPEPDERAPQQR
ncbi:MAG TPA: ATP-dependent DNA ligase [Rhodoglobus sp.]|nr:ATP-dependent DNA ligase [Rhodoglobus sp.]